MHRVMEAFLYRIRSTMMRVKREKKKTGCMSPYILEY
jgi:hypothetical protein